jgi:hypothetical protein
MLLDDKHLGNMMPQAAAAVIPGMHFDPMRGGMVPDLPGFQVNPQVLNVMAGMDGTATVAVGPDGMPMVANPGMPLQNMPGEGQPGMYFDPMKGQMVQAAAGHVDPATGMFVPDEPNAGPNQPGMMQTPMGSFGPQGPGMHFDPMKGMMVPDPMLYQQQPVVTIHQPLLLHLQCQWLRCQQRSLHNQQSSFHQLLRTIHQLRRTFHQCLLIFLLTFHHSYLRLLTKCQSLEVQLMVSH